MTPDKILAAIRPKSTAHELVRIGGDRDGAYLLPDDLVGIGACFSPGVNNFKWFEDEILEKYGIKSHMCDKTCDPENFKTPLIDGQQTFQKKWLDVNEAEDCITLDNWVSEMSPDVEEDLMLQMDIEDAEYRNLLSVSLDTLRRFRIIVVEFHNLKKHFKGDFGRVVKRLEKDFITVHAHPNNCCGEFYLDGYKENIPNVLELTFLRNDREVVSSNSKIPPSLPNFLDIINVKSKPPLFLNEHWCSGNQSKESKITQLSQELEYYKDLTHKIEPFGKDKYSSFRRIQNMWIYSLRDVKDQGDLDVKASEENLSEGRRYFLSSAYKGLPNSGIVELKKPFFFHTDFGVNESITIDLGKPCMVTKIAVANRTDVQKQRASLLLYQLHNCEKPEERNGMPLSLGDGFYSKGAESAETLVNCKVKFRYVTIFSPVCTALHLSWVCVYGFQEP